MNIGSTILAKRLSHLLRAKSSLNNLNQIVAPSAFFQVRNYAARRGTRERKQKAKVKVEVKKVGFIPHNLRDRDKILAARKSKIVDDSQKPDPLDDVFVAKLYKPIVYSFENAVKLHREDHHPEILNQPNSELRALVELNMQAEKKTKFLENFKRIAAIPHRFEHGEDRTVIVFAKNEKSQEEARNAGAQLAGGVELIKQIQNGSVLLQEFQHIIAHPDILPELVVLRGVMKKRFPNPKAGTLDINLGTVVEGFLHGISYQAVKDEYEREFGVVDTIIGTLNMDTKHLEENFAALINDIYTQKAKRTDIFIRRCFLWSPPSVERIKIDFESYLLKEDVSKKEEVVDEEARIAL